MEGKIFKWKFEVDVINENLIWKFEVKVWSASLKLKFEVLKFEAEVGRRKMRVQMVNTSGKGK
jgi:hypothetical protein